jgi:ABC-type Mn2+/Zn2+ transport system ATPase subunit
VITLNEDQEKAVTNLRDFILFDRVNSEYMLSGPAGTGKSTIIRMAIKDYKGNVFLTATTNQAVDVLKTIWETQSKETTADIYVGTIHKLLGLYLDIEYDEETENTIEVLKFNPAPRKLISKR